jgi:Flp pilus assembly protein TadG
MAALGQRRIPRSDSGSIALPAFCLALIIALAIGGFCLSFNRAMVTRSELQNAADAAAIAAAQDLAIDPEHADKNGLKVAALNFADGQRIAKKSKDVKIKVDVINSDGTYPGWVKVDVAKAVTNPFHGLAGIPPTTTVSVSALSGVEGNVVTCFEDQLFPLAVSIDAVPMERLVSAMPLNNSHLGDSVLLLTNAQQTRNATFTSFFKHPSDCDYIADAMDQTLGVKPRQTDSIPRVSTGQTINLNNSALGTHHLAGGDQSAALMRHPVLTLPVIEGNPQQSDSGKVIGFISMRVQGFTLSASGHELDSLRGTLIKGSLRGQTGSLPSARTETNDAALKELTAGKMKLLPANYLQSRLVAKHIRVPESQSVLGARPLSGGAKGGVNAASFNTNGHIQAQSASVTVGVASPTTTKEQSSGDSRFTGSPLSGLTAFANPQVLLCIWFLLLLGAVGFAAILMRRFFALVR